MAQGGAFMKLLAATCAWSCIQIKFRHPFWVTKLGLGIHTMLDPSLARIAYIPRIYQPEKDELKLAHRRRYTDHLFYGSSCMVY